MEESEKKREKKGKVCVTGGTGFVASWLVMRLLQHGYTVNTTVRSQSAGSEKDISFLENLPGAQQSLRIFNADLENPDSFEAAIEGCIGVFHVAHPINFENKETEAMITNKSVKATLGILKACLNSKTVKRVVYTSSASTVTFNENGPDVLDEEWWSDLDYVRKMNLVGASYRVSKTATERAALEFAENNSLDVVCVIPTRILGPFLCPGCPESVRMSLAMIMGNENQIKYFETMPFVHTDDVASAHIFLFEYPEAKGRYICSAVEITVDKLIEFVSQRYPQFQILNKDSLIDAVKIKSISSKKLLDTGFRYKYGLEEMFDEAIECCKKKGFL
ncbi:Flavonol reductase/cinnamoyl-CoA reductase [Handroanthus impetiginosus]|uniref:Dihydroflavonol 4-reductase n=1 Tax=Handroanthus impetiginosus TaxID=429701 RepID=A0A2G9H2S8_9LAMI|nr:Flavonol reductase/cinnamoyl-CoA reductase [Handroanthus impetiginosus]